MARKILIYGMVIICLLIFVVPFLYLLYNSFKPNDILFAKPPVWIFKPTLGAYMEVFINKGFYRNYLNSLIVSVISTILVILLGTPAAYSFARFKIRQSDDLFLFILSTRMSPAIALAVPFYLLYVKVGLLGTYLGLVLAYLTFNLSFYIWIMRGFFRDIPRELEETAVVDGYSMFNAFCKIVFPLAKPGIVASGIICFIFAWNELLFAYTLGGGIKTLPVAIPGLMTPREILWGELSAIGAIIGIPILVLVFFMQKSLVRGLTMGAVKG